MSQKPRGPPDEAKRDLVVVGASGGEGLEQIRLLLSALPADLDAAVLVVLHRPPDRSSHLQAVLARVSRLPVRIAVQGEPLAKGICYIGEPAEHLAMCAPFTALLTPDGGFRNRSIDLLFNSAAATAGPKAVGVILAGSLADGARGLAAIRAAGGAALVQDSHGLQCPGMPQAALSATPDAEVFDDPGSIGRRLVDLAGRSPGTADARRIGTPRGPADCPGKSGGPQMTLGPVQGPGTTPGGGQSGRPGVAGGTTGQKSFEQSSPNRDEGDASDLNEEPDPSDRRETPK